MRHHAVLQHGCFYSNRRQYSFWYATFLCKHLFTLLCVTLSPWTSPFVVQARDDCVRAWCVWLPWISRSVCAIRCHVGRQHEVSENALHVYSINYSARKMNLVSCAVLLSLQTCPGQQRLRHWLLQEVWIWDHRDEMSTTTSASSQPMPTSYRRHYERTLPAQTAYMYRPHENRLEMFDPSFISSMAFFVG